MGSKVPPIRVRISRAGAERQPAEANPKERFWADIQRTAKHSEQSAAAREARFVREFGGRLRDGLVDWASGAAREAEKLLYGRDFSEIVEKSGHRRPTDAQSAESEARNHISRVSELRQQIISVEPSMSFAYRRAMLAQGVFFSVRIDGYSSLSFSIIVGGILKLVEIFESDYDSFRVFLDAFIPEAFAGMYGELTADELTFEVDVPEQIRKMFEGVPAAGAGVPALPSQPGGAAAPEVAALRRAERLRRWVSSSLLVPFLLALGVLYFAYREAIAVRNQQWEAMKPVIEHQLKLLEEDRARFATTVPAPPVQPGPKK